MKVKGAAWQHSSRLGYITTCPSNIGTGIRCSVLIQLHKLAKVGPRYIWLGNPSFLFPSLSQRVGSPVDQGRRSGYESGGTDWCVTQPFPAGGRGGALYATQRGPGQSPGGKRILATSFAN